MPTAFKKDDVVMVAPGAPESMGGRVYPATVLQYPAKFSGRTMVRVEKILTGGTDYILPSHVRRATPEEIAAATSAAADMEQTLAALTLSGATGRPAEGALPRDAGEFAALWNDLSVDQREEWVRRMQDNARTAHDCYVRNHSGEIRMLRATRPAGEGS